MNDAYNGRVIIRVTASVTITVLMRMTMTMIVSTMRMAMMVARFFPNVFEPKFGDRVANHAPDLGNAAEDVS